MASSPAPLPSLGLLNGLGVSGVTFAGTVPSKTGTIGVPFAWASPALDSYFTGGGTYALLTGTLPPGLTINATTGHPEGTPTFAGNYTISIRKTATSGSPATADTNAFTITISAAGAYSTSLGPFALNTGSGPRLGHACSWSIFHGGAIGSLTGCVLEEGTGTTDVTTGLLFITGLSAFGAAEAQVLFSDGGSARKQVVIS